MNAIEAIMPVVLLVLGFHWLVKREFGRLEDPAYLRRHGVVIVSPAALDTHAAPIGRYSGCDIWASVTFKGMLYRFDHIVPPRERERISARELYLEPGLVYVTD